MNRRYALQVALAVATLAAGCGHSHQPPPVERTGPEVELTALGKPLTLTGETLTVGDAAPEATLTDRRGKTVRISDFRGKVLLLSVVPELGTAVCDQTTRELEYSDLNNTPGIAAFTVSADSQRRQRQWCKDNYVRRHMTLSDEPDKSFGRAFGLRIEETGRLGRAVIVIDQQGVIRYIETQRELARSPDLEAAEQKARALAR